MKKYDFLIVGAGLFGAVFAHEANKKGRKCLVIDKRAQVGGNLYCENMDGINVHMYGAHIFHTSDKEVWKYVNQLVSFNRYTNTPIANYRGELYNLPFNMNTFYKLWGVKTPVEAQEKIKEQAAEYVDIEPLNLEEQALKLVGKDIYEKLIKGYTEKQWGVSATKLPAFIIRRIPLRFTFDNNYFSDPHQGIPEGGYNKLVDSLLVGSKIRLNTNYFDNKLELDNLADCVLYTGMLDEYFDYKYGQLEYRGLRFEHERVDVPNYQGNAVVNYTERDISYTRVIEHKHFEFGDQPTTVVTKEYPEDWSTGKEPYYPINNKENDSLYLKYKELAEKESDLYIGGRLADYKYYDMDKTIRKALDLSVKILK